MTSPDRPAGAQPLNPASRYGRAVARQWPVVLLLAVLGALVAPLVPGLTSSSYTSTAVVEVQPQLESLSSSVAAGDQPNMVTEQAVAHSSVVISQTLATWQSGLTVSQFQGRSVVTNPNRSTTLSLAFTGRTAREAQQGAQAWADTYVALRKQGAQASLETATRRASDSVAQLETKLQAAEAVSKATQAGTPQAERADADVRQINVQLTPVRARLDALSSMDVTAGRVIGAPALPRSEDGLPSGLVRLIGLGLGLILGVVVALLVERVFGRVRTTRDVRGAVSVPVWSAPRPKRDTDGADPSLAVVAALLTGPEARVVDSVVLADPSGDLAPGAVAQLRDAVADRGSRRLGADRAPAPVLLAAPGLLTDPDAVSSAVGADLVLLLAQSGKTQVRHLRRAAEVLDEAGARLDGVVLVHRSGAPTGARSSAPSYDGTPAPARP